MSDIAALVADNLDLWTSAIDRKSSSGRGSSKKISLYGIERLRALILDLAIHGKLVAQCENDQPAAELLKLLPDEWPGVRRRKSKPKKSTFEQVEFELPSGWVAAPGTRIFGTRSGNSKLIKGKLYPEFQEGLYPGFSASGQDVWLDNFEHEGVAIILSAVGARCGKAFLAQGQWSAIANTHIVWMEQAVTLPAFAMLVLNNEEYWERAGGAQPFVKVGNTLDKPFFLPPLAEQERIVAKVDELMALCDALEQESEDALAAHQSLVETLLATLTTSTDAADLAKNWARLDTYFDTLFTTEPSIDSLKQTILDLAVRGRLVEQDADDEPASELIARVQAARAKVMGAKRASKVSASAESDYKLPPSWQWEPLLRVGVTMTGGTPKSSQPANFDGQIPFIGPGQISPTGGLLPAEKFVSELGLEQSTEAIAGDVLMVCIGGSIGKTATARARMGFNQQINAVRPIIVEGRYVAICLQGSHFQKLVMERATGSATPIINRTKWETIPIALPPLAEQKRIVAKVDELIALCEQLKSRLVDAAETQRHLAYAIVERAAA